jgi:protein-disulfide isomerase
MFINFPIYMNNQKNLNTVLAIGLIIAATAGIYFYQELQTYKSNGTVNYPPATGAAPTIKKPIMTDGDYFRGNKNAKVTLVEYSDYECPFCKSFHPTMLKVMEEYGEKIKWIYRHYPLSFHANAQKAAEAAECVGKLAGNEAFWKFSDLYYEKTTSNGDGFPLDGLSGLGEEAGANKNDVQLCLDNGEMAQKVKGQFTQGGIEGVSGTPGTIIIDAKGATQLVPGAVPFEQLKPMIDAALQS